MLTISLDYYFKCLSLQKEQEKRFDEETEKLREMEEQKRFTEQVNPFIQSQHKTTAIIERKQGKMIAKQECPPV